MMVRIILWFYTIACLYFIYSASLLLLNVLVSVKYNAFSESDVQLIKSVIIYALLLVFCSFFIVLIKVKRK